MGELATLSFRSELSLVVLMVFLMMVLMMVFMPMIFGVVFGRMLSVMLSGWVIRPVKRIMLNSCNCNCPSQDHDS